MGHAAPKIATIDGIAEEIAALLGPMLIETIDHADELTFIVVRDDLASALTAPHPDRLRVQGASAAQGLPADRLCRTALFRGRQARRL